MGAETMPLIGWCTSPELIYEAFKQPRPPARPWLDEGPPALKEADLPLPWRSEDGTMSFMGTRFAPAPSEEERAKKRFYWPIRTTWEHGRTLTYYDARGHMVGDAWKKAEIERRHADPDRIKEMDQWERELGLANRVFGARRGETKHKGKKVPRRHVAMDLYGNHHDPIVACEDGKVISYRRFYEGTWRCLVEHEHFVINYGEIEADWDCQRAPKAGEKRQGAEGARRGRRPHCPRDEGLLPYYSCRPHCRGHHANRHVQHQGFHPLGEGDSLMKVASFYGLGVKQLLAANPKLQAFDPPLSWTTPLQDELKSRGRKRLRGLLKRQRTNSEEARSSAERGKIKGRYGLVLPARLAAGAEVKAGDVLGEIGRMGNDGMLHFEIYPKGAEGTSRWLKDELSSNDQAKRLRRGKSVRAKPTSTRRRFLDPTLYLRFLALHGL